MNLSKSVSSPLFLYIAAYDRKRSIVKEKRTNAQVGRVGAHLKAQKSPAHIVIFHKIVPLRLILHLSIHQQPLIPHNFVMKI